MLTCQHAEDALTRCPPGYADADISTFVHCGQAAAIWTLAIIAIVEVTTAMVFLVPDIYNQIKEKGRAEGIVKGREEGRKEGRKEGIAEGIEKGRAKGREKGRAKGREEGRAKGREEGRAAVAAAMREAMRDAGIDEETRRRVEDALARRARRNDN